MGGRDDCRVFSRQESRPGASVAMRHGAAWEERQRVNIGGAELDLSHGPRTRAHHPKRKSSYKCLVFYTNRAVFIDFHHNNSNN